MDSVIAEINARGYWLNNLFQLHAGGSSQLSWQCNVTDGKDYQQFHRADTALEALQRALACLPKPAVVAAVEDPFA